VKPWSAWSWRAKARLVFYPTIIGAFAATIAWMTVMPGASHRGALPLLTEKERVMVPLLRRDTTELATEIGARGSLHAGTLERARTQIELRFTEAGYTTKRQDYEDEGATFSNLEVTRSGTHDEIVVVGAHYDSAYDAPGADDNASGVAVLLALARATMMDEAPARTIRFVAFVNEEPPHFWNPTMGSMHYARACKERGDRIVAMLSLESLGYYRDEPGSQKYPPLFGALYPDRGDFVSFIGDTGSRSLVRKSIGAFRDGAKFPSEGAALPRFVAGVGWSDQWSFWQFGYPGVMVTDTAPFRNPNYHTRNDTADTLDYERMARVVTGLDAVVRLLARP
jgi:predicted small integral membrane protein